VCSSDLDTDQGEFGTPLLIDNHGCAVSDPVWALLKYALAKTGPQPLLIEWDTDVPEWAVLQAEAGRAASALAKVSP